jgi:nucleoside-diphosphate-sugar epimerase
MSNRSILVTGANGFVGRAVCAQLSSSGFSISALTRAPTLFDSSIRNAVISDLGNEHELVHAMNGVDTVIHLAARVHVMTENVTDSLSAYRAINVDMTLTLARQAAVAGVRRFIYMSSVKVNGECTEDGQPFTPDDIPKPEDPYGISKMEAEQALLALSKETGLEVVIIRPPLVYGPGVGANFLAMMRWVSRQLPLPLGAIHNRRSMVALSNLVDFISTCINHPNAIGQIFLISDDQDVSVTELLKKLAHALKVRSFLLPVPVIVIKCVAAALGRGAVAQRLCDNLQVDISKSKKMLDWAPPMSLDQGLQITADWYLKK